MRPALIVNENFPAPASRRLREQGVDVLSVQEELPGASDETILAKACETGRWLVTYDRDYGELVYSRQCPSPPAPLGRLFPDSEEHDYPLPDFTRASDVIY